MNKFRIRNNVPDVYVKKSRDFQLLCDLFDVVNNGVKFDIDSIMDLSNTQVTRESMLTYLQSKLGFNTSKTIPQDVLRTLLKCFPYLVKRKGSRQGIEEAICLFLNVIYADCQHDITIFNNKNKSISGNYVILVSLKDNVLKNLNILDDLLKYVLPTGYVLNYDLVYSIDDLRTNVCPQDVITVTLLNEHFGSKPRKTWSLDGQKVYKDNDPQTPELSDVAGAVGTTIITTSNDPYESTNELPPITTQTFRTNNLGEII